MSRRIEKCHICKGTGLITVDDWLTKGMTEEQIAKKKEEALADIVEVVRCKDCKWWEAWINGSTIGRCENPRNGLVNEYSEETDFCSYGERKG